MKSASKSEFTFDPQPSPHQRHETRANGQPEPRAAKAARRGRVRLRKGIEDRLLLVERNADPRVVDGEVKAGGIGIHRLDRYVEDDLSAFGKFDRVAHQVRHDLPQPKRVAD